MPVCDQRGIYEVKIERGGCAICIYHVPSHYMQLRIVYVAKCNRSDNISVLYLYVYIYICLCVFLYVSVDVHYYRCNLCVYVSSFLHHTTTCLIVCR